MNETAKIGPSHLRRPAVIYVRQSSASQVERNTESTARQYGLASRAVALGWPASGVRVIDDDLGLSGASAAGRSGFAELAAQVGLGQVGMVLALEVSRLARNNSDWYRLLDLAGMTDTLIADSDGVYHPAMFNDRLLLGMKGAMSEALWRYRDNTAYGDLGIMPNRRLCHVRLPGSGGRWSALGCPLVGITERSPARDTGVTWS
jgi:hypothetical protein